MATMEQWLPHDLVALQPASATIQRRVRGRQQRLRFLEKRRACTRIQTCARGANARHIWSRSRRRGASPRPAKPVVRLDFAVAMKARTHWKKAGAKVGGPAGIIAFRAVFETTGP